MPKHREMKGVIYNFVETYSSRNTDFGGYWLFGQLLNEFRVRAIDSLTIDLFGQAKAGPASAIDAAASIACQRFRQLLETHSTDLSDLRSATLNISQMRDIVAGSVDRPCKGHRVEITACAVTLAGAMFRCSKSFFVAPHDPRMERRSTRFDEQTD